MDKYNAIQKTKYIRDRYKNYLRTIFKFGDENLQCSYEKLLNEQVLFKGPYVSLDMPFVKGKNLVELMEEGIVCKSFRKLSEIDFKRLLYAHQERAIRHIGQGRGAIITTGTGSGKTESFLYPILNDILKEIEAGSHQSGIRAMLLYPMNALINDQIDRIRAILQNCPEITFGFFTGETKEKVSEAERARLESENEIRIPPNELLSREEMRETPPHILFTNYSMLEYMLIRPDDYKLFAPENLHNWKYVVLDEAHTYSGATGIELSFLLRRVTGFAPKRPNFILTSATLGEQGKSEKEIAEFASKLTGNDFVPEDIVFADRYAFDKELLRYVISGADYTDILNSVKNNNLDEHVLEKYHVDKSDSIKNTLYSMLIQDKNTYKLYEILHDVPKDFSDILQECNGTLAEEELVSLIELLNYAENRDGRGIFDLKYHSFVRPLSGAYISMAKEPELTLCKTGNIGEYKAFEVGVCNYCGVLYLIGKIKYDEKTKLSLLVQNQEVDIYENYGDKKFVQLDYFLLDNNISEEDEELDSEILEKFDVCSKCGACKPSDNVNNKMCDCGQEFRFPAYRVVRKEEGKHHYSVESYNNLTRCPICGQQHNAGVVRAFNLGKDKGTATIGQFLFEALDDEEQKAPKKVKEKYSIFSKKTSLIAEKAKKVKQFLTFSDSRQQASFAAVYFDAIMQKSLYRRLIWKVIEENKYQDLDFETVLAELQQLIKDNNLFEYENSDNKLDAYKNAWIALLGDLLKRDGQWDSEGLGIYFFDLDLSSIMSGIGDEDLKYLEKYNLNKSSFESLIQIVLEVFKTAPAIEYVKSKLSPDEKIEYLEYKGYDKYICYKAGKSKTGVRSFMPIKAEQGNRIVRYVQKACGLDSNATGELLNVIFNNVLLEACEKSIHKRGNGEYQIKASQYIIKNYKNHKYYQCQKCHRLTPYNVNNACVKDKCTGSLKEINPDEVLKDNFYRNEYMNGRIEKVIIKEHTAQLDRKIARLYQNDFKNKKINILSCSTTFEMGIDLGDLDTVYMRNIPPSPANYVQRAGRAGRRTDKSAFVLTYCNDTSHDYTYFMHPEKMISGTIKPPYFEMENRKIMSRHLLAASLGFFFKKYPSCFAFNEMILGQGEERFYKYMQAKNRDLSSYIDERVIPEEWLAAEHNFEWFDKDNNNLKTCIENLKNILQEYENLREEAANPPSGTKPDYKKASEYQKQIDRIKNTNILKLLSTQGVIPRYGFPVDVINLDVYTHDGCKDNSLDLNRDLKIAISEYAPESEVIVNGKKYTSRYIGIPYVHELPRYNYVQCPNCNGKNIILGEQANKCKYCGEDIADVTSRSFIIPESGFKTGDNNTSGRMKPRKTYAGEVSYIGGGENSRMECRLSDSICVSTSSDDELMVMNRANFLMCPTCGYSEKASFKSPRVAKKHQNYHRRACMCQKLEPTQIGYVFKTDVARFSIEFLRDEDEYSYDKALSFLYAFLEGISIALSIDRRDIDGIVERNFEQKIYDILIYDSVPGGAGYVKRLLHNTAIKEALEAAKDKISHDCCDENTSCYNCLRNYYNQAFHARLKRKYAKEVIEETLSSLCEE